MCGYDVVAADKALVVPLLRRNVEAALSAYDTRGSIDVVSVDWSDRDAMEALSRHLPRPLDLVVCSDCVYQLASVDPLLSIIEQVYMSSFDNCIGPLAPAIAIFDLLDDMYIQMHALWPNVRILFANEMRSSFDEICTRLAFEGWTLKVGCIMQYCFFAFGLIFLCFNFRRTFTLIFRMYLTIT